MQEMVDAAVAEMMAAWIRARTDFPGDHPANAERWLKEAYASLNVGSSDLVPAETLYAEYASRR